MSKSEQTVKEASRAIERHEPMTVTSAVAARKSVRAFTEERIETDLIVKLLEKAARAPSGGNLQPWRIRVLNGDAMVRFKAIMKDRMEGKPRPGGDTPQYQVYPSPLGEPYRSSRFKVGEDMYGLLGISRDEKPKRLEWFANNYQFFGAPTGFFCFVDRQMGPPQWSDLGMFLQTFMLLAEEAGLATCPQECWAMYPDTVADFCEPEDDWMLFCGMAIGHEDKSHPVNQLRTEREQTDTWLKVIK